MAKKGGDTRVKRQMAPVFWDIRRKESQFVLSVKSGSHSKDRAYPLGIVLRDVLKLASTMHEAERIVNSRNVKIDGIIVKDINFAVGLMDVIELVPTGQSYRFVPNNSELLVPISISDEEKTQKLVKVTNKITIRGKKLQYSFHDGKTLISDQKLVVGDSCLLQIPDFKINKHIKFAKGCMVLVTRGENAGSIGKVDDIKDGIFSLPKRALISFSDRSIELPVELVMAIGDERPIIRVS
jgi:small subunit ribosomal protein S4e